MIKVFSQWVMPVLLCGTETSSKVIPNSFGFGDIANNLLVPIAMMSSFLSAASLTIGIGFLLGSAVRFRQWRRNYMANSLSTVFFLFLLGVFLLLLPLVYHLTESGIPSLMYV